MGVRYICTDCGNVFDSDYVVLKKDNWGKYLCPIRKCGGTPFAIDEMMIHPILKLNKKGISTYKCCSGHIDEEILYPYIIVKDDKQLVKMPDNWEIETADLDYGLPVQQDLLLIKYSEAERTKPFTKERLESINKAMTSLYDWVDTVIGD